jgi:teichuronic acid biosynthesis glycosyltransferase TuaC
MRILFVTLMFPNKRDIQHGNLLWELARALQAAGQDVRVASIEPVLVWPLNLLNRYRREVTVADMPEYDPIVRYEVRQFPRNIGMFYMYKHWAKVLMEKINTCWPDWRPQIVHSHTLIPGALIAEVLCRKWNIAHISTSHGGDTSVNIHRRKPRAAIKRMLSEGHRVVGVGQPIVESLKAFAKKPDQIRCIFNGMDIYKLRPASPQLRQRFRGRKIILGMGNLKKTKGFDLLLKGFSALSEEFPLWDVAIVGGGAQSDELKKLADELNLFDRVHFTGPLPSSEAMEWMDLCDIFCLPSWSEGFGVVYIEAMACSKPVIGVSGQGIDAVIREHSTGLLVEPKDDSSVSNALRQLMADDSLRRQMGAKGKELVFEKFTWAVCAQKYVQLYSEILANKQIGIIA